MKGAITLVIYFITLSMMWAQKQPAFLTDYDKKWVDSVYNSLSVEEKVGQLLMPRGNVSGKPHDVEKLAKWVKEYKIGGVVFFAGPPSVQARLTNYLQALSKTPLFIGEDFEWGLAMRMDSTDRFPYQMALGAMNGNEELIKEMGAEVGRQCKRLGVHINYAPVVDVNNNIANPVINFRSFGSNKMDVTKKGLSYMLGMQEEHIISTAKHFPGHGDTDVDSHKDLPVIAHNKDRLFDIELYPFQQLINQGLSGVMTAHLDVPALEPKGNLAATFSKNIVSDLLRNKMGFKGLTFTDAMDMKGAVKNFPNGEAMVKAILAGNDVLETFEDLPTAYNAIVAAVKNKTIPMEFLNEKVLRILKAKSWVGLNKYKPIELKNLVVDLNTKNTDLLNRGFAESYVTILKDDNKMLPISDLTKKIAVLSIDNEKTTSFQSMCANYTKVDFYNLPINAGDSLRNIVLSNLKNYDHIIAAMHLKEVRVSSNYSINESNLKTLEALSAVPNTTLCLLGNVLSCTKIKNIDQFSTIVLGYQNTKYTEVVAAQIIFGGLPAKGKLPISLNEKYKEGYGLKTQQNRLSYGIPDQVGINGNKLNFYIDSIVNAGLKAKAYPGAVVQILKDGKTIFSKAYGYHTFEDAANDKSSNMEETNYQKEVITDAMDYFGPSAMNKQSAKTESFYVKGKVQKDDLYDLASITKIATSALSVMQLSGEKKFDLNKKFGDYVPNLIGSNKENLVFKDMLTHRSGLQAWIPFWRNAVDTMATIQKAIIQNPQLENLFEVKITKPSFFKRLFGKKTKKEILYLPSIMKNETLWTKCFNPSTIVWKPSTFSSIKNDRSIALENNLWMDSKYQATLFKSIKDSPVNTAQGYVYSDLHYYYYPQIIETITNTTFDKYLSQTYNAIGARSLCFNPVNQYPLNKIVPTEYDSFFRKTLIHGYVHDEGATMMGGISGHAGLFGNANDLSKLMYLYLNEGKYGKKQFFPSEVIREFSSYQFKEEKNRRGIFFDKLDLEKRNNGPSLASDESYGHSGFTGTFTWLDPKSNLLYVFLSNRVYPTRDNKKISEMNIRTEIGNAIYRAMK